MNSKSKNAFSLSNKILNAVTGVLLLTTQSAQAKLHSLGAYQVEFKDEQGFTAVENIWGIRLSLTSEPSTTSGLGTNIGVYDMELNDVHFEFDKLRSQTQIYYEGRKKWLSEVPKSKWIAALPFKEIHHPENKVDGYQIGFKYEISGVKQNQFSYYLMCDKRMFHLKALVPEDTSAVETAKIDRIVASFRCERDAENVAGHARATNQNNWKEILKDSKKSAGLPAIFREFLMNYEVAHGDPNSPEEDAARNPVQDFIQRYLSPKSAYANDSSCFFAGWTSSWRKNDDSVPTCAEPKEAGNCGPEQIQCNPAAFGQVCVERIFKQNATQVCNSVYEKDAAKHEKEIEQFLEKSPKALNELASAADHLCEEESYQQSNYGLCSTLYSRLDDLVPVKDGPRQLDPAPEMGLKADDYQKAFDVTQDEAKLFENFCLAPDHQSMVSGVQVNGQWVDCIKLKDRLLQNLRSLDHLDSKTNFKAIEASTCAVEAPAGEAVKGTVAALKKQECSQTEEKEMGHCGADIFCAAIPALGFLPKISSLSGGSCNPVKDNCAVQAVTGIMEALWSTVKGLASMAGKVISGVASDTYRLANNSIKDDMNGFFGTTYKIDNASSYKTVQLAKTTTAFISDFMKDPGGSMKKFMNSIMAGVSNWMKSDVFCEKWSGVPHLSTCIQPSTSFGCNSCKMIINGSCAALGYVASEVVGAILTGGAKGALDAAGVTAKVASMLGKAGELGKLKYAKFAEKFPEAAAAAKLGAARAGTVAKVTGKVIGGIGEVALFPAKFLVGKAGKLVSLLEKIPVAGKAVRAITLSGEKAKQFAKWYVELNKKAFSLGERSGNWVARKASRTAARAEAAQLAAKSVASESTGKASAIAESAKNAPRNLDKEMNQLQYGREMKQKQLAKAKSKAQRKIINEDIQKLDRKIATIKTEKSASTSAGTVAESTVPSENSENAIAQIAEEKKLSAEQKGELAKDIQASPLQKNIKSSDKNRELIKFQNKLQEKYGLSREQAKIIVRSTVKRNLAQEADRAVSYFGKESKGETGLENTIKWRAIPKEELSRESEFKSFRDAFSQRKLEGEAKYISYLDPKTGNRLIARAEEIGADGKSLIVSKESGEKVLLNEKDLQTVKLSGTSRVNIGLNDLFKQNQLKAAQASTEAEAKAAQVQNEFKKVFESGNFQGDSRYVRYTDAAGKHPIGEVVSKTPDGKTRELLGNELSTARVSEVSKAYFDPRSAFQTFKRDVEADALQGDRSFVWVDNGNNTSGPAKIIGKFKDQDGLGVILEAPNGHQAKVYARGLHQITQRQDAKALFEAEKNVPHLTLPKTTTSSQAALPDGAWMFDAPKESLRPAPISEASKHRPSTYTQKYKTSDEYMLGTKASLSQEEALEYIRNLYKQGVEIEFELGRLGWSNLSYGHYPEKVQIFKEGMRAPMTSEAFHGTTTAFFDSIKEHGLNNAKGKTMNRGLMPEGKGVPFARNIDFTQSFAETSSAKTKAMPIIYKWNTEMPGPLGQINLGKEVPAASLDFSFDGMHWYKLSEHTLEDAMALQKKLSH